MKKKLYPKLSLLLSLVLAIQISVVTVWASAPGSPRLGDAVENQDNGMRGQASAAEIVPIVQNRTKSDIVTMAKSLTHKGFDKSRESVMAVAPKLTAPYAVGQLAQSEIADVTATLKMLRYLAGVPYQDVGYSAEFNNISAHGATLMAASGQFGHYPTKPEDMDQGFFDLAYKGCSQANISAGYRSVSAALMGLVADGGSNNIEHAGHRRWVFAPGTKDFGVGFARNTGGYSYASMYVFGGPGPFNCEPDTYVAWPSAGDFPIQYFVNTTYIESASLVYPWSINLGAAYERPSRDNVILKLTRTRDNKVWTFNSATPNQDENNFNRDLMHLAVDNQGMGMIKAIVFRPDVPSLGAIQDGDVFKVDLSGINKADGTPTTLSYDIRFFDLEKAMSEISVDMTITHLGQPVEGARVIIDERMLTTDQSGRVSIPAEKNKTYSYTVTKDGFESETGSIDIKESSVSIPLSMRKSVTFSIGDTTKTYNGSPQGVTVTANPAVSYVVQYEGSTTVPTRAGVYSVRVSASAEGYAGYATGSLVINAAPVTIRLDDKSKTVGAADPVFTYTFVSGQLFGSDAFSGAPVRMAGETAGAYAIMRGTLALPSDYQLSVQSGTLSIFLAEMFPQNIVVNGIAVNGTTNKLYGDQSFTVEVTPDPVSKLADFTFISSNTNVATIDTVGKITIVGAGTTDITVEQAGGSGYLPFTATGTLSVAKRAISVKADDKTKPVGGTDPALTYTVSAGSLTGSDAFTGALTRDPGETAGEYAIKQGTLALSNNYILAFTAGQLTIAATQKKEQNIAVTGITVGGVTTKTYGDLAFKVGVTPDPASKLTAFTFGSSNTAVATIDNAGQITIVGAGTATITVNQAGDNDYLPFAASGTLNVAPRAITVKADDKTKTVGGSDPALTYSITAGSLVGSDTFSGALTRDPGETPGTYTIRQGSLALNDNYTLNFTAGALAISGKLNQNVTVSGLADKTYGAAPFSLTVTPDPASQLTAFTFASSNTSVATIEATGQITIAGAGQTTITVKQAGNQTYNEFTYTGLLTVAKASLTVTANNSAITYGDMLPTFTYTITGFLNGDTAAKLTTLPSVAVDTTGKIAAGTHRLAASGGAASNYNFLYTSGMLTVNKKDATVTGLKADNRLYAAGNTAATVNATASSIAGKLSGDDLTVDISSLVGKFADDAVGTGKTVTITGIALAGADKSNYQLTATTATTTADILAAVIPVSSITVTAPRLTTPVNGQLQMTANVLPSSSTNKNVTWKVIDPTSAHPSGLATISASGLLTAGNTPGNVQVVATSTDGSGIYGMAVVEIVGSSTKGTYLSATPSVQSCKKGQPNPLSLQTDVAANQLTYSSSNNAIASVNSNGVVLPVRAGMAIITVRATDGSGLTTMVVIMVTN